MAVPSLALPSSALDKALCLVATFTAIETSKDLLHQLNRSRVQASHHHSMRWAISRKVSILVGEIYLKKLVSLATSMK